ncbi:hypothetical protein NUSPORA_02423 [Nucleospora cyclopteri]
MEVQQKRIYQRISLEESIDCPTNYSEIQSNKNTQSNNKNTQSNNKNSQSKSPLYKMHRLLQAASHPMHFNVNAPSAKTKALIDIISICGGISNMRNKAIVFFQSRKTLQYVLKDIQDYSRRVDGNDLLEIVQVLERETVNQTAADFNNNSTSLLYSSQQQQQGDLD